MLFINRLVMVGLLSVGIITAATTAHAGAQLFTAEWSVGAFGNECDGNGTAGGALGPQPYCGETTGDYEIYSNWAMPAGFLCNPGQPRCDFDETPVDGTPNATPRFAALGGSQNIALFCTPYNIFTSGYGNGSNGRPDPGNTVFETANKNPNKPIPPLYRNTFFFTGNGAPKITACTGTSIDYTTQNRTRFGDNRGKVMQGIPVTGTWYANQTGSGAAAKGFSFPAAPEATGFPAKGSGFRATGITAEFTNIYPYIYSYTYATFRNDKGVFGTGKGAGDFSIDYSQGANRVAKVRVQEGKNKFGGTMRMLGQMTTKVCYYRNGGCSLGEQDWRYDAVGATAMTANGVITKGYIAYNSAYYYATGGMQLTTVMVEGARFPWTTGMVTVTAVGRGPHKTVHYGQGYDNRDPVTGKGTIQLVTPVLTRWLQTGYNLETGGVGLLRIKFVPEPQTWVLLIAGVSLLGAGYRMRGR